MSKSQNFSSSFGGDPQATREEIEFDHLARILAGIGTKVRMRASRPGRMARAMFEAHISSHYDRPGCFGFVGWKAEAGCPLDTQWNIYAAFARAAVASDVFLGGMEPNEGFGLTCWLEASPLRKEFDRAYGQMLQTIQFALGLLLDRPAGKGESQTRIAIGIGRIRGSYLFSSRTKNLLLDGPKAVGTIYGDIPNRCGAMAKNKDSLAKKLLSAGSKNDVFVFRQPWTHFHLLNSTAPKPVWGKTTVPAEPIQRMKLMPLTMPSDVKKPFLVALSLDFANSRMEYTSDAHRARSVINQILTDFEELTLSERALYVSPRYGDGVAAIVVVEAVDPAQTIQKPWMRRLKAFAKLATNRLRECEHLGLRIGLAIDLDKTACTPRLAGISQISSPAVEPLAREVIEKARRCHGIAKKMKPELITKKRVRLVLIQPLSRELAILR